MSAALRRFPETSVGVSMLDGRRPGVEPDLATIAGWLAGAAADSIVASVEPLDGFDQLGHQHDRSVSSDATPGDRSDGVIAVVADADPSRLVRLADQLERRSNAIACELRGHAHIDRRRWAIVMQHEPDDVDAERAVRSRLRAYSWWGGFQLIDGALVADDTLRRTLGLPSVALALDATPRWARWRRLGQRRVADT